MAAKNKSKNKDKKRSKDRKKQRKSREAVVSVDASQPAASDRVRNEWIRRVEAEYRSAAITQHLTLWLIQMGASPDLISDGLRIVTDELTHAELSHAAYVAAGGTGAPQIDRDSLGLKRKAEQPLEFDVTRAATDVFCLGETVAVPLFKELRQECSVPEARAVLDRVLVDEVRHRDFGWTLLEWLLELPSAAQLKKLVEAELPRMFTRIRSLYSPPAAKKDVQMPTSERAWGLMPSARYGAILERCLERDYLPRFERLGIDAQAAWDRSQVAS